MFNIQILWCPGVSSVQLLEDMTMISCGNDSQLKVWKLSTARAPGKTLVWATPTHSADLVGKFWLMHVIFYGYECIL